MAIGIRKEKRFTKLLHWHYSSSSSSSRQSHLLEGFGSSILNDGGQGLEELAGESGLFRNQGPQELYHLIGYTCIRVTGVHGRLST